MARTSWCRAAIVRVLTSSLKIIIILYLWLVDVLRKSTDRFILLHVIDNLSSAYFFLKMFYIFITYNIVSKKNNQRAFEYKSIQRTADLVTVNKKKQYWHRPLTIYIFRIKILYLYLIFTGL